MNNIRFGWMLAAAVTLTIQMKAEEVTVLPDVVVTLKLLGNTRNFIARRSTMKRSY